MVGVDTDDIDLLFIIIWPRDLRIITYKLKSRKIVKLLPESRSIRVKEKLKIKFSDHHLYILKYRKEDFKFTNRKIIKISSGEYENYVDLIIIILIYYVQYIDSNIILHLLCIIICSFRTIFSWKKM